MNHMLETMERIFPNDANGHVKAQVLFDLAKSVKQGLIVEVGSSVGAGTIPLALGSLAGTGGTVVAIDINSARGWANEEYTPDMRAMFYRNLIDADVAHQVSVVQLDQWNIASTEIIDDVGLLFFDLGKRMDDYETGASLVMWSLLMAEDGVLAINETGNNDLGVDAFVGAALPEWTIVDIQNRIRILRRRDG